MMNKKIISFFAISVLAIVVFITVVKLNKQDDGEKEEGNSDQISLSDHPAVSSTGRNRKTSSQWSLPFKVPARLDEGDQLALAKNPEEALAQALADKKSPLNLIVAWAGQNPDAAMRWVDLNADSLSYGMADILGAVAAGHLIHAGPDAMMQFIGKYNNDPRLLPKAQGGLDRYAFRLLGRSDTIEQGLKILQQSQNGILAGSLIGGIDGSNRKMAAIDYMEAKKVELELNYWSLQSSANEAPQLWADWALRRNSDLLPELVQSWARDDGKAARAWMDSKMMKDDPRLDEIRALID